MYDSSVAIIGAGWYGCHIASTLLNDGFSVSIYEESSDIFTGASRFNQNRLHLGFHYPRCSRTRSQSKRGFHLFLKEYSVLTSTLDYNLYAIHDHSTIDFETYKSIMRSDNLSFEDVTSTCPIQMENIEGVVDCQERYIDADKAREFFNKRLRSNLKLGETITDSDLKCLQQNYDYVIDCTWGGINSEAKDNDLYYEACVYFLIESSHFGNSAITVMDGDFFFNFPLWKKHIHFYFSERYCCWYFCKAF